MYRILSFVILFALWVVFSGLFDAFHLTLGILSVAFITYFTTDLFFENRDRSLGDRIGETLRLIGYLFWLLWQIILANWHVLRLSLLPHGLKEVEPEILVFKCKLKTGFAKYLFANSITLTPGTVTISIVDDMFHVHSISRWCSDSLGADSEMERRIAAVFREDRED